MLASIGKHLSDSTHTDLPTLHHALGVFKRMFPNDWPLQTVSESVFAPKVAAFMLDEGLIQVPPAISTANSPTTLTTVRSSHSPAAMAIIDVESLVLGYVGIHLGTTEMVDQAVLRLLGCPETLECFGGQLRNLSNADSPVKRARAIFDIAKSAYRTGIFSAVFGAIRSSMHFWDWIVSGVAAVAHMEALALTDGAAFVDDILPNLTAA